MNERAITTPSRTQISDAKRAHTLRLVNRPRSRWRVVWEWAKSFQIAVLLFLVIRTFIVEAFKIPTGSMERTLLVGDFLLVNKAVYGARIPFTGKRLPALEVPERGDVVVFEYPVDPTKDFVKRLIGLPGDTVEMRDGVVWLNGRMQDEPYVVHVKPGTDPANEEFRWQREFLVRSAQASVGYRPSRNNWGPLVVPEGKYFVLGDNRDDSSDSRYWGFVPQSAVKGRPLFVYYSYERDTFSRAPWVTNVRWMRVGELIK